MNGKHVLVVEDDYLANLALCEILQDCGYQTESAYCAAAALASLRRRPPLALITDLDLGRGDTGFDVARFARWVDPTLPVLYVSGHVNGRFPRDGVGGSQFLAKPYRDDRIVAALRELINAASPIAPSARSFARDRDAEVLPGGLALLDDERLFAQSRAIAAPQLGLTVGLDLPPLSGKPTAAFQSSGMA